MESKRRKALANNVKYIIPVFLFLIYSNFSVNAQKASKEYSSILLIPLQYGMFESDINEIPEKGFMTNFQQAGYNNNTLVRHSLDKTLFDNLLIYFDIKRLLYYDTKITKQDLEYIYESIDFFAYHQRIKSFYYNFPNFSIFQIIGSSKKRWGINCLASHQYKPMSKNPKLLYTDVIISDTNLVPYLTERYKCDYILFVNHMELKTRFRVCMDLLSNIYQKDIILHFTLYDKEAEKIIGGLVGITYAPSENDLIEIVEENFGILASLVAKVISTELHEPLRVELDY